MTTKSREMTRNEPSTPDVRGGERGVQSYSTQTIAPPVDIYENDQEVLLIADLPGVLPADVHIRYEKGELNLRARRSVQTPEGTPLANELRPFDYARSFRVTGGIDPDKIEAELNLGILRLHLPKQEQLKPRQIPIKASS